MEHWNTYQEWHTKVDLAQEWHTKVYTTLDKCILLSIGLIYTWEVKVAHLVRSLLFHLGMSLLISDLSWHATLDRSSIFYYYLLVSSLNMHLCVHKLCASWASIVQISSMTGSLIGLTVLIHTNSLVGCSWKVDYLMLIFISIFKKNYIVTRNSVQGFQGWFGSPRLSPASAGYPHPPVSRGSYCWISGKDKLKDMDSLFQWNWEKKRDLFVGRLLLRLGLVTSPYI